MFESFDPFTIAIFFGIIGLIVFTLFNILQDRSRYKTINKLGEKKMTKCKKCGKIFNILDNKIECQDSECEDVWCEECTKIELKECDGCKGLFCATHLPKSVHECEEDDDIDDDEMSALSLHCNNRIAILDFTDENYDNIFEAYLLLRENGYVVNDFLTEHAQEGHIVFEKGGKK